MNNPQATQAIARDFVQALLHNKHQNLDILPRHKQALRKINELFSNASKPPRVEIKTQQPRVFQPTNTDSTYTTAPHHMAKIKPNDHKKQGTTYPLYQIMRLKQKIQI